MRPLSYPGARVTVAGVAPALSLTRRLVGVGLVALLVALVFEREAIYTWFAASGPATGLWLEKTPLLSGLWALMQRLLHMLHRQHGVGIGAIYSFCFIGLSWAILGVLIPGRAGWRWGAWLYGGLGAVSLLLLLVTQLSKWPIPAQLADAFLYFLVSPMPLMVLLPLWHATQPSQLVTSAQQRS